MAEEVELLSLALLRDDDEGLFSRDISGQLVRLDAPTASDYDRVVNLQIDGQPVQIRMAEPQTDANGNILVDLQGNTKPRYTTIYDAAVKLYVKQPGDEAKIPIPVLCHQPHMKPVAVCRLCVVQIYGQKRGKREPERKLLPACHHLVKEGMEVFTMNDQGKDGAKVRQTVKVMTEMLASDHLKVVEPPSLHAELAPFNELGQMSSRCGAKIDRFRIPEMADPAPIVPKPRGRGGADASSPVFQVDHSACILCDRCVRACDEVKENHVIGRTGKGTHAGIGFDFNDPMGKSSCVQCGECMVSCPTSAITYKPVAQIKLPALDRTAEVLPALELMSDPLFAGIPPKFLLWQKGLVIRRRVKRGQILCRQGDPGNTAFIIKTGELEVTAYPPVPPPQEGIFANLLPRRREKPFQAKLTSQHVIVGEMSCVSGAPRNADVVVTQAGEVWEVRRNVLDRLMRVPHLRTRFEEGYRKRSLGLALQDVELFRSLKSEEREAIVQYLQPKIGFSSLQPGQRLFEQGNDVDDVFIVRMGHVRIAVARHGNETKVISAGPGTMLGEIGLLAFTQDDAGRSPEQAERELKTALDQAGDRLSEDFSRKGKRTATVTALGDLELARIGRADFLQMVRQFPGFRRRLVDQSLARLRSSTQGHPLLQQYVDQGLYEGQSLLVLDTDRCTRCDECTKGCIDRHGSHSHGVPITRMLRDGLRFDRFLIATACRSCSDPHCMAGCPVDSIHRGRHLQIVIEDHCIGCGLCAQNCPYGNIFIVPNEKKKIQTPDMEHPGHMLTVARPKAVTCDLCDSEGSQASATPQCVASCPHEAASRMSGPQLLEKVMRRG